MTTTSQTILTSSIQNQPPITRPSYPSVVKLQEKETIRLANAGNTNSTSSYMNNAINFNPASNNSTFSSTNNVNQSAWNSTAKRDILSTIAIDIRDVLATNVAIGLSIALGFSMNSLIGAIADRYIPGNPHNIQHQVARVIALAVITVVVTIFIARVVRPQANIATGPSGLLLQAEQQVTEYV